MILFAHIKFGLVRIQGSGVKRGAESAPRSERVFLNLGPGRVNDPESPQILGYFHTVPDRFSLRFKSCPGTV